MRKRIQLKTGIALTATAVAVGLLAGCGDSSDSDEPAAGGTTATTGMTGPASAGSKPGNGQVESGKSGTQKPGKKKQGRNPASAGDKRGPAPDDAISRRPGGPESPQRPQADPSAPN
ncbi:MAG: hypothetical protein M3Y45_03815 [Actinomycetota bacterium]|nr:hypothetical protein [Actinomycetota bacterium]